MKLDATRQIDADRATVWAALLSAEVLRECVPGCQELTGTPEDGFEAVVVQKVGPVKATFRGTVTLSDRIEGESLTLRGEGKGGAAGFAKGGAEVRLDDGEAGGTALTYHVEARVGGKLAQLGSRVINSFSKKMADQFFSNFQAALEGPEEEPEDEDEKPDAEDGHKKGWFKRVFSS